MARQADRPAAAPEMLCPSARCEPGAKLIGVVAADGLVAYLRPALEVDDEFVAEAVRDHRQPGGGR